VARILHHLLSFENGVSLPQRRTMRVSSGISLANNSLRIQEVIWNGTEEGRSFDMLDQQVDDKGTDQTEAREIIRKLCDSAFEGDAGKLAVGLGRSTEQVQAVLSGAEPADDDLIMKARGIAINRGVEVE